MSGRPFRVLGVQQIAIGGSDKATLRKLWVDLLGAESVGSFRSEAENVDEAIVEVGVGLGLVEIDLMQPIDPAKSPKVATPALNHIGLWVDDLPSAVEWLTKQGVRFAPGGVRKGAAGYDICFIHPKGSPESPIGGEGVLIELVQAPQEIVEETTSIVQSRMVFIPDLFRKP
jgi:lactoylglutathione lyase